MKDRRNRIDISEIFRIQKKNNLLGSTSTLYIKIIRHINPKRICAQIPYTSSRTCDFKCSHGQHVFVTNELLKASDKYCSAHTKFWLLPKSQKKRNSITIICCIYISLLKPMNHILWLWKIKHNSITNKLIYDKVNHLPWSPYLPRHTE